MSTNKTDQTTQIPTKASPSVDVKPESFIDAKFSDKVTTPLLLESVHHEIELLPNSKVYTQKTTLNFKNFSDKQLEGELVFPLPDGATVCGYALQIDDDMVEATVVTKKKAQKVFKAEVRNRETVSVIEKVVGNQYKTSIYPWEPNSTKTVRLEFVSNLMSSSTLFFQIPIESSKHEKLSKVTVSINTKKEIKMSTPSQVQMETKDDKQVAEFSGKSLEDLDMLTVEVDLNSSEKVSVEKSTVNGSVYFNISDLIEILQNEETKKNEFKISIIWDCSLSREKLISSFEKVEFVLLKELLSQGKFTIDLHTFSNTMKEIGKFENYNDLVSALKSVHYDGGTNIYQLNSLNLSQYDYCLLFTDGLDSLSRSDISPITFKSSCPIYCLNSSSASNRAYLKYISEITTGAFYQLNQSNVKAISKKIGSSPFSFLSAEYNEDEITEVYPSKPTQIDNSLFHVNGILLKKEATITLNFGFGKIIKEKKSYKISDKEANSSKIVGLLWAKSCLSEMECFSEHFESEILAIGREFGVVTKDTSLIVLKTLNQHIEHNIVPSKSRKKLYGEYMAHLDEQQKKENAKVDSKLQVVKSYWSNYMSWYNQDFVPAHLDQLIAQTKQLVEDQKTKKREIEDIKIKMKSKEEEYQKEYSNKEEENKKKLIERKKEIEQEIELMKVKYNKMKEEMERKKSEEKLRTEDSKKMERRRIEYEKTMKSESARYFDSEFTQERVMDYEFYSNRVNEFHDFTYEPNENERSMNLLDNCLDECDEECEESESSEALPQVEAKVQELTEESSSSSSMNIKSWDPNVPYINELKKITKEKLYETYMTLRKSNQTSPAFYLDCCDYFFKQGLKEEALRIISNLSELEFDSHQLLRIIGYKLEEIGELQLSIQMFRKVLSLRPDEPQSYRDLALVLEKAGEPKEAIQLFYKVITGNWDSRFQEIEITALQELNRCIDFHGDFGFKLPDYLRSSTPLDLRIIMAWDSDMTDIDLHTIEPNGEEVYYGHKRSALGGLNSRDFTGGYGPETYSLKSAMPGKYIIKARYYSSHQQTLTGGTTILLTLFTDYGVKGKEKCQQITIRLSSNAETFQVADIEIKNAKITKIENELDKERKEYQTVLTEFNNENKKLDDMKKVHLARMNELNEEFRGQIAVIESNEEYQKWKKLVNN